MEFDLIVRNGVIANAADIIRGQDIGIKDGVITCIGTSLPVQPSTRIIDAEGAYVTPGGVDSHVHLDQVEIVTGDTWLTGTRSAICGGTTTVICFAQQLRHETQVIPAIEAYATLAKGETFCDYGFHLIMTNPTKKILEEELPVLVNEHGVTSVKLYMTYKPLILRDSEILQLMTATRRLGMTTMIHAENHDMIAFIIESLEQQGLTDPYFHAVSRPAIAEGEATFRAISLSELMDTPILLVHVSAPQAAKHIRDAQARLLPVYGETCPQYLWLLSEKLKGEQFEGAKYVCSPPVRDRPEEMDELWDAISNGTFTTFSSDHAATKFNAPGTGKRLGLVDGKPLFSKIPNGIPGVETRLPLLFKGVTSGRLGIHDFVRVCCTNPAKLYGLTTKGTIAAGFDGDLCIWYPDGRMPPFELDNSMLHHDIDYTPYEGMEFENWPRYTILRGKVVWDRDNGGLTGSKGDGVYLKRAKSVLPGPRGKFVNEWRPPQ
ncbi:hypothetical protein CLAIMM_04605 [Cladophialophora immunda]|nr:hypothetical protein CLAIMM_04605 [Cladophialophora immunda]